MTYKSYSDEVRYLIAKTKDPNLFPHLKIPKTTAKYWISKGNLTKQKLSPEYFALLKKIEHLEKENKLRQLLEKIKRIAPLNKETEKVVDSNKRKNITKAIKDTLKFASLAECLKIIGLTKSTYYR